MNKISIGIIGDNNQGKTTYATRLASGLFISQYTPTQTPTTRVFNIQTNIGPVQVELVEYPANFQPQHHDYILWFGQPNSPSASGDLHCFSRADTRDLLDQEYIQQMLSHQQRYPNIPIYDVSSRSNYNIDKPLLVALRKKFGKNLYMLL